MSTAPKSTAGHRKSAPLGSNPEHTFDASEAVREAPSGRYVDLGERARRQQREWFERLPFELRAAILHQRARAEMGLEPDDGNHDREVKPLGGGGPRYVASPEKCPRSGSRIPATGDASPR
jgi:hypothetical protein